MKNAVLTLRSQMSWMKSELHRWLAASMLFSVLLVLARTVYTGERVLFFLVWNLFLAYVPFFITGWLQHHPSWIERRWRFAAVFTCWLLFIPNTFYILTDLFHLRSYWTMPMWYDLALLLSFAWNGLVLGLVSVRQMERIVRLQVGYRNELWFVLPVMCLNAFGIYIGRYLRFNSWDVITSPFSLAVDIFNIITHPVAYSGAWGMTGCYALMMSFIYVTVQKLNH